MGAGKVPLGRAFLTVGEDPTDAAAYARLGAQVGVVFANKLAVDAMFAGTPWGAAITAAKFGAQVGLFVLSMGAVQDALGEGPTLYLRGQLTIAGATASLLGDTSPTSGRRARRSPSSRRRTSSPSPMRSTAATRRASRAPSANIAMDYYKLQTGVDLRLYGRDRRAVRRPHRPSLHRRHRRAGRRRPGAGLGLSRHDPPEPVPRRDRRAHGPVRPHHQWRAADINDSYRILGQNALTGLLLVGTRLDDAGNAIRDVAHKVGGFFTDILHGLGIDGYISGATVFADANFNGVLDAGEALDHHRRQRPLHHRVERRAADPAGRLRHRHQPGLHRHDAGAGGFDRGHAIDHPDPDRWRPRPAAIPSPPSSSSRRRWGSIPASTSTISIPSPPPARA